MRCPKCGYISFDNVEKCPKCKKNSIASVGFLGSVLAVATPTFLKFGAEEEELVEAESPEVAIDEVVDTVDEDFDVVDPDLDILMDEDDDAGVDGDIDFQLDLDDEPEAEAGVDDELADLDELSGELSEIEAFAEDADEVADDTDLDLAVLEETAELDEEPDIPAMDMPDELADLSDLSPPVKDSVDLQPEEPAESPAGDLDFSGLDDILNDTPAEPEPAPEPAPALAAEPEQEETVLSLDMDEDLDFELDLGGLSIHDDNK